jgi:hypothetical protein
MQEKLAATSLGLYPSTHHIPETPRLVDLGHCYVVTPAPSRQQRRGEGGWESGGRDLGVLMVPSPSAPRVDDFGELLLICAPRDAGSPRLLVAWAKMRQPYIRSYVASSAQKVPPPGRAICSEQLFRYAPATLSVGPPGQPALAAAPFAPWQFGRPFKTGSHLRRSCSAQHERSPFHQSLTLQ